MHLCTEGTPAGGDPARGAASEAPAPSLAWSRGEPGRVAGPGWGSSSSAELWDSQVEDMGTVQGWHRTWRAEPGAGASRAQAAWH